MHKFSRYFLGLLLALTPLLSHAIPSANLKTSPFSLNSTNNESSITDNNSEENTQTPSQSFSLSGEQYFPDALILLSSDESFKKSGIDVNELADLSGDIILAFNNTYEQSKDTGSIQIFLEISAISQPPEVCAKDYRKCVLMSYFFEDDSQIKDKALFEKFTQQVLALKEIHFNPAYDKKIGLIFHLNYPVSKAAHTDDSASPKSLTPDNH
jgi:hypothetical protein